MKTSPSFHTCQGFTLVELLVVIVIIGILVSVSMPIYQSAVKTAQMNAALQGARQVVVALRMYAADSNGLFPDTTETLPTGGTVETSNDAFRLLMPTYLDNEKVFTTPKSLTGAKCDNKIDPVTECLKAGENEFSYIAGISTTSTSSWPLVLDGTDGNGKYTDQEIDYGGTWGGVKQIVVNVDSSALIVKTNGTGANRTLPRYNDDTKDALAVTDYMGSKAKLLDPARP